MVFYNYMCKIVYFNDIINTDSLIFYFIASVIFCFCSGVNF